jgi:hypothetical protein
MNETISRKVGVPETPAGRPVRPESYRRLRIGDLYGSR